MVLSLICLLLKKRVMNNWRLKSLLEWAEDRHPQRCSCWAVGGSEGSSAGTPRTLELPWTGISADSKRLFLLPHTCYRKELGSRKKLVSSFLLLESARTVVTVPTWITGNTKGTSRSNPEVCYLLGFFVFNDTNLAPLPGAFWLLTHKRCFGSGSVLGRGLCGQEQQQHAGGWVAWPRVVWHTPQDGTGPTKPALLCTCAGGPTGCSATQ